MINNDELIAFLVNKVTKGVRKQLKGYVDETKNEIECSVKRAEYTANEFKLLIERASHILEKIEEIDLILNESKENKKLLIQMKAAYRDIKNKMLDINLMEISMKQALELNRR